MKLLDLYCGAGGSAVGYHRAGFTDIVGVDIVDQPRFPFTFIQDDALAYLRHIIGTGEIAEFALVHASPPCQAYTVLRVLQDGDYADLVAATRRLLRASGRPYVIENVPGAPLLSPIQLCGSSFGLRVRRHRLFETSHMLLAPPCRHHWQDDDKIYRVYRHGEWIDSGVAQVYGTGGGKANEHWPAAMGISWMTPAELAQAIPPAYCEYIGKQMMSALRHYFAATRTEASCG